jgi:hypothetical protein
MMKRETTIWVVNDHLWEPPEMLEDFVEWANGLLESVPQEYRSETRVDVESEYDSSSVLLQVWYKRMETDEEEAQRERQDEDYAAATRERELRQLAALMDKYGTPQR